MREQFKVGDRVRITDRYPVDADPEKEVPERDREIRGREATVYSVEPPPWSGTSEAYILSGQLGLFYPEELEKVDD